MKYNEIIQRLVEKQNLLPPRHPDIMDIEGTIQAIRSLTEHTSHASYFSLNKQAGSQYEKNLREQISQFVNLDE